MLWDKKKQIFYFVGWKIDHGFFQFMTYKLAYFKFALYFNASGRIIVEYAYFYSTLVRTLQPCCIGQGLGRNVTYSQTAGWHPRSY